MSASSSEVRSATVAMRQWSTSSASRNSPTTVCVFPASIVNNMAGSSQSQDVQADVEHRHRVRERADRDEVGARLGVRADRLERDAARHLDLQRRPRAARPPARTCSGVMLSSSTRSAAASRASTTWSSVSHSTSIMRPGHDDRARSIDFAMPVAAT